MRDNIPEKKLQAFSKNFDEIIINNTEFYVYFDDSIARKGDDGFAIGWGMNNQIIFLFKTLEDGSFGCYLRDFVKVERTIRHWQPDVVVNCVGLIKHKMDDSRVLDAVLINSVFPHQLARLCDELKTRLIHFSTDCVFAGTPGVKRLTDIPNATDVYGTSKRLGEVGYGTSLTLRTSIVGRQISGTEALFEWIISQRGKDVNGFKNAIYSGLTTRALSEVVQQVIERHSNLVGLYQVASLPITKFDLISHLNDVLRLNITINPDTKFECDRTLDGSDFGRVTGIQVPSWNEMLSDFCSDQAFYS